jgi:hypothetical protein
LQENLAAGAKQAAEKGRIMFENGRDSPQRLKPALYFLALAARLKSCPDTVPGRSRVFQQPVKSVDSIGVIGIRRGGKSCPDTKLTKTEFFSSL